MKIETVFGVLPVFIWEYKFDDYQNGSCRLCFIRVSDIEDRVVIEHEKNHARENYVITLSGLFALWLSFLVSIYLTIALSIVYFIIAVYMNLVPKGVYEKEVRAYKISAKEYSEKFGVSYDTACEHYARILLNTKLYGNYAKQLGLQKIKKDLLD